MIPEPDMGVMNFSKGDPFTGSQVLEWYLRSPRLNAETTKGKDKQQVEMRKIAASLRNTTKILRENVHEILLHMNFVKFEQW